MIKIGIDLATKKTGVVVIEKVGDNVKIKFKATLVLEDFIQDKLMLNMKKIKDFFMIIKKNYNVTDGDLVTIEYNIGFDNTPACGIYGGIILSMFPQTKFIIARTWQSQLFGEKFQSIIKTTKKNARGTWDYKLTKQWARERFIELTKMEDLTWTEDEIDAFWIAYLSDTCESYFSYKNFLTRRQHNGKKIAKAIRRKKRVLKKAEELKKIQGEIKC